MRTSVEKGLFILFMLALIIWIITFIAARNQHDKYLESKGAFEVVNKDYSEFKKTAKKEKDDLMAQVNIEQKAREKLESEKMKIETEKKKIESDYEAEKKKTATLTADELCNKLNAYVPNQYSLLATGNFSLTRYGGDQTYNIFLDRDSWKTQHDKEFEAHGKTKGQLASSFNEIKLLGDAKTLAEDGWAKCDNVLIASENKNKALEKSMKWAKIKNFGKGMITGGIITTVALKLIK